MKYIKTYEGNDLQIGDWVICTLNDSESDTELVDFINNNIGQYFNNQPGYGSLAYEIQYANRPESLEDRFNVPDKFRRFPRRNILHSSKNKEDLLRYINQNKYNL
jgi:hypothetical protein